MNLVLFSRIKDHEKKKFSKKRYSYFSKVSKKAYLFDLILFVLQFFNKPSKHWKIQDLCLN